MNAKPSQSRMSFNTSGLSLVRGQQKARHEWRAWVRLSPLILPESREEPAGLIEALQRVLKRQKAPDAYAQALPVSDKASHSPPDQPAALQNVEAIGGRRPCTSASTCPACRILGAGRPKISICMTDVSATRIETVFLWLFTPPSQVRGAAVLRQSFAWWKALISKGSARVTKVLSGCNVGYLRRCRRAGQQELSSACETKWTFAAPPPTACSRFAR